MNDFKFKFILITGVAGFIASAICISMVKTYPEVLFIGVDKLSYCSNEKNLEPIINDKNFKFIKCDLTLIDEVKNVFETYPNIDGIFHLAAYTHVDQSFGNSIEFTINNILGTHVLLEFAKNANVKRFIHISTDEVYGSNDEISTERSILDPTNPYAATKAAAEHIVKSYYYSFKLPTIIMRINNLYGPYQYPEKVIPKFILRLLSNKKCILQGSGLQTRSFLYIDDLIEAFLLVVKYGKIGEVYNVNSEDEINIQDLTKLIISKVKHSKNYDRWLEIGQDRNFNDVRYNICGNKMKNLGWTQKVSFEDGLNSTISWYVKNKDYWSEEQLDHLLD